MSVVLRDIMQTPVVVLGRDESIARARNMMLREKISRLIVMEGDRPIGMITKKDIMRAFKNYKMRQRDLDSITVAEVMRCPIATARETDSIEDAARKMVEEGISGLPVYNSELTGIVTKTDLTRYFAENMRGRYSVKDLAIGLDKVPVLQPSQTIFHAMDVMDEKSSDIVIIVESGKPIGVITETDLSLIRSYRGKGKNDPFVKVSKTEGEVFFPTRIYLVPTVGDVMTHDPVLIDESADAGLAAGKLIENDIGGMPVVNSEGDLVGLIRKIDFVKVLAKGRGKKR